jgi:hypothetical protein
MNYAAQLSRDPVSRWKFAINEVKKETAVRAITERRVSAIAGLCPVSSLDFGEAVKSPIFGPASDRSGRAPARPPMRPIDKILTTIETQN